MNLRYGGQNNDSYSTTCTNQINLRRKVMINVEEYPTNLRVLLSEVIELEPEHFQQATAINS